jgi:flagellar export protein FliJ
MKRFVFRLESLLRLKRQKDRQAESRQLHARRVWEGAQLEVDSLLERLMQCASAVEARIGQAIETDRWIAQYEHMTQVRLAVDSAEAKAKRAMTALEEANRLRRITAAELEALKLLRQEQWQEHRKESAQAEQQRLDDAYLQRDGLSRQPMPSNRESIGDPNP